MSDDSANANAASTTNDSTEFEGPRFADLNLIPALQRALDDVGYENPSLIQAAIIPKIMEGRDVIGQAQTGTGKTAAFALPILNRIDLSKKHVQCLVLTPTRELAIQVAEAFQKYAAHMPGFHVLPIYGGQAYGIQLHNLQRGVHVVVGTPGRVMDHLRRQTLDLDGLKCLVLDEADEMLRMGFIDDVEWILEQTPAERQVALFSATMPTQIRRISQKYLNDPAEITIKVRTSTAETIRQRFWMVSGLHKLDALTRILEFEPVDAAIVFVRTKNATTELAQKLESRGFSCAPLSGDIQQNQRERTIDALKSGKIDILVATDVAARGLDVERITHVFNYDIPNDTEAYVHRVGRTGRAGRNGEAILFVAPRERRMLHAIEQATRQKIEPLVMPTTETINDSRISRFKQAITDTLGTEELGVYYKIVEEYCTEHNVPAIEVGAALALLCQGDEPLLLPERPQPGIVDYSARPDRREREQLRRDGTPFSPDAPLSRYRIEVGAEHGVKPGNIVGAIANESGIDGRLIGRIDIHDAHTTLDLPANLPADVFETLQKIRVAGRPLRLSAAGPGDEGRGRKPFRKPDDNAAPSFKDNKGKKPYKALVADGGRPVAKPKKVHKDVKPNKDKGKPKPKPKKD